MMRVLSAALCLALAACTGTEINALDLAPSPKPAVIDVERTIDDVAPSWRPAPVDRRPVWAGHEATRGGERHLAARAHGDLDVYFFPDQADPFLTLPSTTILGTPTVLSVVGEPHDGWVEVMLPVRPNGTTGWVRADRVWLYVVDGQIVVDLSDKRLWYYVDGVEVLSTEIGVGSRHNQTPIGEFFVTDNVTLANPNSPWGPHALGLSARSETIVSYNGGDGIIGIHGTNNPGSIGGNISLGCIRLPNDMITILHEMVPLGTRVQVRA